MIGFTEVLPFRFACKLDRKMSFAAMLVNIVLNARGGGSVRTPYCTIMSISRGFAHGAQVILNSYPNDLSDNPASPFELLRGRRLDCKRDFRVPMGTYVQTHEPHLVAM